MVLILLLAASQTFAADKLTNDLRATYNISDNEISDFLDQSKLNNPNDYAALIHLREINPEQFEITVCSKIIQTRVQSTIGNLSKLKTIQNEQAKSTYNITGKNCTDFLNKLKLNEPKIYNSLITLKNADQISYENTILPMIIKYRETGSLSSPEAERLTSLQQLELIIENTQKQWRDATSTAEKEKVRLNLKTLIEKEYDAVTESANNQIKKIEIQIDSLKESAKNRISDKEKNIDEELAALTTK